MSAKTSSELIDHLMASHKFNVASMPASTVHQLLVELKEAVEGDRAALVYVLSRFDAETFECRRCGYSETCSDMDSADYLRKHLGVQQ